MSNHLSDDEQVNNSDDELSYEPFDDDVAWQEPTDDLDAIDLDALEAEIETEDDTEDEPESEVEQEIEAEEKVETSAEAQPEPASESAAEDTPEAHDTEDAIAQPDLAQPAAPPPVIEPEQAEQEQAEQEQPAQPAAAAEAVAIAEVVEPTEMAETPEPSEPDEPPIPPDVYCAVLALPPDVGARVLELRETGEIANMPPPGVILTPQFRAQDITAVQTALADWTRIHLPIQLEITDLQANIVGAQQYVAAWTLEPAEELQESLHTLKLALADLILPLAGTVPPTGALIIIGDHVPPHRFPQLVGSMQRDFEAQVWQSTDLQLMQQVPDSDPLAWDIARTFD